MKQTTARYFTNVLKKGGSTASYIDLAYLIRLTHALLCSFILGKQCANMISTGCSTTYQNTCFIKLSYMVGVLHHSPSRISDAAKVFLYSHNNIFWYMYQNFMKQIRPRYFFYTLNCAHLYSEVFLYSKFTYL